MRLHGLLDRGRADGFMIDFVDWGFYPRRYWRNSLHTHSYHEVCLAWTGEGRFTVDGSDHAVRKGDVFLARPGQVHEIVSSRRRPLGITFWGFTVTPGPGAAPSSPGWWRGLYDATGPVVSDQPARLPATLGSLLAEAARPRSGQRAVLTGLGVALAIETARTFAGEDDLCVDVDPVDRTPALVAVIERYLLDNLDRPVSVGDLAGLVHLSDRHTERLFLAHTGKSLMAALRHLRLDRAATLLLETSLAVGEVAHRCGYPEARPFATAFRRHHGQSPTEFRRHHGTRHL